MTIRTRLFTAIMVAGSVSVLVATAVTMVDVVARALGSVIIHGTIDIVGIMMVVAISAAMPFCEWRREQIVVELFSSVLPATVKNLLDRFWSLAAAVFLAAIGWYSLAELRTAHSYGDVMPTLGISVLVYGVIIFIFFVIAAIAAVLAAIFFAPAEAGPSQREEAEG